MENKQCILFLIWYIMFNRCVVVKSASFNCTFDDGFCTWSQINNRNFKLTWGRQRTSTSNIGPDSDHTSGVGGFIYINSSNELANKNARLSSKGWQSSGNYCLSFWYYMYGRNTDKLRIAVKEYRTTLENIFVMTENQRKMWIFVTETFRTIKHFKLFIDGFIINDTHGFGYIAVDDVKMFPEKCPRYCSDPTPVFGKAVVGDIWSGSTVSITCREGYEIKGNSSILCHHNGKWSDSPTCQALDCGKPTLGNNMSEVTSVNTTFNTTITLSCSQGYTLIGNSSITCMANGNWSILPRCVINNCSDPTPTPGNISDTDFNVGSSVHVSCDTGYKLIGDSEIVCLINSTWSDNPVCKRIECSKPNLTKGLLDVNGTSWYTNDFVILACAGGYTLRGNVTITCQDSGNWTILPTCDDEDISKGNANSLVAAGPGTLIAVGVILPLFAISVIAIVVVIVCRKRKRLCMKDDKALEHVPQTQYSNKTHRNIDLNIDSSIANMSSEQDTECAVIVKENPPKMKDVIYYNTVKHGAGVRNNADYDHTKGLFEPILDNTYSHIGDSNNDSKNKQRKNSRDYYSYTNAAFLEIDDEYNLINLHRPKESINKYTAEKPNEDEEKESDYDHAKAGGCDPVTLDLDEYSHLNTAVKGHGDEIANTCTCIGTSGDRDRKERKCERQADDTPQYCNVEQEQNSCIRDEDRHYFVSEGEETDGYFNTELHDYFILEKIE